VTNEQLLRGLRVEIAGLRDDIDMTKKEREHFALAIQALIAIEASPPRPELIAADVLDRIEGR